MRTECCITDCTSIVGADACVKTYRAYVKKHYPNFIDCLRFICIDYGHWDPSQNEYFCGYSVRCIWKETNLDDDLVLFKLKFNNLNNFIMMVGTEIEEEAHGYG